MHPVETEAEADDVTFYGVALACMGIDFTDDDVFVVESFLADEAELDVLQDALATIMSEDFADEPLRERCRRTFRGQVDLVAITRRDLLDEWWPGPCHPRAH